MRLGDAVPAGGAGDARLTTPVALAVLALAAWLAHYRLTARRVPRLDFAPTPFLAALVPRMASLREPFAPTPWLYSPHLQLAWLVLREALAPRLEYDRTDVLRMRDGGTTALDWLGLDDDATTPTIVLLPGITGDAQGLRDTVRDLRRHTGWRVVVCARRGHGDLPLTAPVFNTMGSPDDLREQLARIREAVPHSPLYAVGVSAGSGLLVRYLGEEGAASPIRAAVGVCPGYDIGVAWGRVPRFYTRLMATRLRERFLDRHAEALKQHATYAACRAAEDLAGFHENLHGLAGFATPAEYLARSNPMVVFDALAIPVLILNADDDPVCVAANAADHVDAVRRLPDALMVRTRRGSHCAFLEGWWPRSWGHRVAAEYLRAAHAIAAGPRVRGDDGATRLD